MLRQAQHARPSVRPEPVEGRRWEQRLPVRLKARLVREVEVLFRHALSGL